MYGMTETQKIIVSMLKAEQGRVAGVKLRREVAKKLR